MKKILFISHEATKTGAPLVLLYFMQWLKQNYPDWQIHVLHLRGGSLLQEFENVASKVVVAHDMNFGFISRLKFKFHKASKDSSIEEYRRALEFHESASENYDIIYANTAVTIPFATEIKKLSGPHTKLVAHIHEMTTIIRISIPEFSNYLPFIDQYIAVSNPVRNCLIADWKIPEAKISLVYECTKITNFEKKSHTRSNVFVAGASGVVHWRKGDDIFIQLAMYMRNHHPDANIKFQWVGMIPEHHLPVIEEDLKKAGLNEYVDFTGEKQNPFEYYQNFDVLLMISREDPFPLVCIEAAMLGKPIICFEQASGTADIIALGGGYVVPYMNIEAMAEKLMIYYQNEKLKLSDGEAARQLFKKFTPENICPEIFKVIEVL